MPHNGTFPTCRESGVTSAMDGLADIAWGVRRIPAGGAAALPALDREHVELADQIAERWCRSRPASPIVRPLP
jgi:hypothetical protein